MKRVYVILFALTLLAGFLRVFLIDKFPVQLGHDEISQLYDAISVAETGKDAYGNFMPTMFVSVNDYKSPFYTYATSLVYLLLGNHEWIIKVPGILFSILMVPVIFMFTRILFKNERIALLSSLLTAIAPFEIFYGRKSFENIIGICLLLLGFASLFKFLSSSNNKWLYLGFATLGIGMYTYFSHAVIIPLLLVMFIWVNKNKLWQERKKFLGALLLWIVLITPLMSIIILNPGSRYRSETVFITQDPVLGSKLDGLSEFDRSLTVLGYSLSRYLEQFNLDYLFLSGLDLTNQGPLGSGLLMAIQLPFVLIGIYALIKDRDLGPEKKFVLAWILIGMIPSGLTFERFSPHRSIMVFTMFNIVCAVGMWRLFTSNRLKQRSLKWAVTGIVSILFLYNFAYFLHVYFIDFPNEKSQEIHDPFKQIALFAKDNYYSVDSIIFDPKYGVVAPRIGTGAHYYIAYYTGYPPEQFQKEYRIGNKPREVLFDKYSIRAVNWREDYNLKNTLVIASPWSLDISSIDKTKIIKTFYFYNGSVAFYAVKM